MSTLFLFNFLRERSHDVTKHQYISPSSIKYACPLSHIWRAFKYTKVTLSLLFPPTTSFLKSNESGFCICSSRNLISFRLSVCLAALQWANIQLMAKCLLRSMVRWPKNQHLSYSSTLLSALRRHSPIPGLRICGQINHSEASLCRIVFPSQLFTV